MVERRYFLENVRKLLVDGFSIGELRMLAFDKFTSIRASLPRDSKIEMAIELVEYANAQSEMDVLLEWAQDNNDYAYDSNGPYYEGQFTDEDLISYEYKRLRQIRFFNLDEKNPEINILISRHSITAEPPTIPITKDDLAEQPDLQKIVDYQQVEREALNMKPPPEDASAFATVSAMELIESLRLIEKIDKQNLTAWFSGELQEKLSANRIEVKLGICPQVERYKELLQLKGTYIFIGGPRANIGTYCYLYKGQAAGALRPKMNPRGVVEFIDSPGKGYSCEPDRNLGIVQKHTDSNNKRTVLYLAGTGVYGTVAAIAYLRLHWSELLDRYQTYDFYKVLDVPRRDAENEDLAAYQSRIWSSKDWIELENATEV